VKHELLTGKNKIVKKQNNIWYPFTHIKTSPKPIAIISAKGVYLKTQSGEKIIDAISSWWVNLFGHSNKYIAKKISKQSKTLQHVIFAGFTHKPAQTLTKKLLSILPKNQSKIFFSDDGSTSVEVALKMAIQYWFNKNKVRTKILAFKGDYHGDTFGAMSVAERDVFFKPFLPYLFDTIFIDPPMIDNPQETIDQINKHKDAALIIFEPLIQGSNGMKMQSIQGLDKVIQVAKSHKIITIADEVFTCMGRTGKRFAVDYLLNKPDIMCISKGITGGFMAMGLTSCTQKIYNAFISDNKEHTFYHGHSYTANPIACSAGVASLKLLESKKHQKNIKRIIKQHKKFQLKLKKYQSIQNIRQLGTIIAFDINTHEGNTYLSEYRDWFYNEFLKRGVLLRPLGNIIYILPPYVITNKQLKKVYNTIEDVLQLFEKMNS